MQWRNRAKAWVVVSVAAVMAMAPAAAKDAMAPLMYLAGSWAGEGWIDMGQGRMGFRQTEEITPRLDGNIITIEGTGRDPKDPSTVVFEAFAVLSATGKPGHFEMRSYTREGQSGTFGRQVRYRSEVVGDRWTEIGEASVDGGATWAQFFEMTLRRTPKE